MLENYKRLLMYNADDGGCGYFRIKMPSFFIEKYGFETIVSDKMIPQEMGWVSSGERGGICILQRQYNMQNFENAKKMKNAGAKLIYEIDDYVHKVDIYSSSSQFYGHNVKRSEEEKKQPTVHSRCVEFYKLCDAITVTTEALRQKLLQYNKNIFVIPNSFIIDDWEIDKQEHNSINILWSGSSTHHSDILEASDAIKDILKKYKNTKLILAGWDCGGIFKDVPLDKKIVYPWTRNIRNVSKFNKLADIGIAPIKENEFNECKSINKFVEYSLTEIPTIASKFGPYLGINDGEDGVLVKNRYDKWFKAIEKLVLDEQLRRKLSSNAKKRCKNEFDINKNILNWVKVYNKVLGLNEMDGAEL